jgi:glycosyltransferase involved in cell wall biosynthesis
MADTPRFSVTVPAYNAAGTVAETIESVQAQTFGDWELVICNDGSTDSTLAIAERYAERDPRIRVVSQENRGSGGAYNTAVRDARADLIVMLSADDLLLPEHLATFDAFIAEHADAAIFSSDGYYDYDDGTREVAGRQKTWADPTAATLQDLFKGLFFNMGAVYRREVFDAVGGFREDQYAEDYLFFLLAFVRGYRHRFIDVPLAVHRRTALQKSSNAIGVRQTELDSIREVMGTGLLTPDDYEAAEQAVGQLKRNIRIRRALGTFLGPARTTRLINRMRGRHP